VLGGREDAQQTIRFALIKVAKRYPAGRQSQYVAEEIARDVRNIIKPLVTRGAAHVALTVELEEDPRSEEARQDFDAEDPLARLKKAVEDNLITDRDRQAIELHYLKGLSIADVAAHLGGNYKAVQRQILRALARVRGEVKRGAKSMG
jgi:RNA polymerase sigma factor (sigma-70 family)